MSQDITWTLAAVLLTLVVYIYAKFNQKHKYWQNKNVAYSKPWPIIGNLGNVFLFRSSLGEMYKEVYDKFPNEKVVGLYEILQPVLVIRDPQLIEKILVKDFQHFVDHGNLFQDNSLFTKGLFQLSGATWRSVRYKLSPAFTSGKLKLIFNNMVDCTDGMVQKIKENLHKDYELRDAISTYTINVIANTVFGIQMKNAQARERFGKMGSTLFNVSPLKFIQIMLLTLFPKFARLMRITFLSKEVSNYFEELLRNTIEQRLSNSNYQRNDYLQHLLKLKEKGYIEVQSKDEDDLFLDLDGNAPQENIELTDRLLYSQAFQFLTAGFEPVYNTIIITMYNLAQYPEVLERARLEVKEVLANNGGYTYQALKEMTYLEQCLQETLRLHPLTPFLFRQCTKNYTTQDGLEIEKGQKIIIPLDGIHNDPKYYQNPEVYIPERLPANSVRSNYTYMPFGDGPRMCIGLRFAMVELKLGLAKILENFNFTLSPKTKVPFEINKQSFVPVPTTKIMFNITSS